jgi:hypothetical protein
MIQNSAQHRIASVALLMLVLCMPALALTASPARLLFDTPGTHQFTITVREYEGDVTVRASGGLASYISIDSRLTYPGEVRFLGTVTVPEELGPGDHPQELIVSDTPAGDTGFAGKAEIIVQLVMRERYRGPYLVANLHGEPDESATDTTRVYLTLENRGNTPVTPLAITLTVPGDTAQVTPQSVPAGGAAAFTAVLNGRGEHTLRVRVTGDSPVDTEYPIALGVPVIERLSASLVPEQGPITPVRVSTAVSWNRPVAASLRIGGLAEKSYDLMIDGTHEETYYTELGNATNTTVTLRIGRQERTVVATSQPAIVTLARGPLLPYLIALVVVLIFASGYLIWRLRARQPPQ